MLSDCTDVVLHWIADLRWFYALELVPLMSDAMGQVDRDRLRVWLKSEQAFGLTNVSRALAPDKRNVTSSVIKPSAIKSGATKPAVKLPEPSRQVSSQHIVPNVVRNVVRTVPTNTEVFAAESLDMASQARKTLAPPATPAKAEIAAVAALIPSHSDALITDAPFTSPRFSLEQRVTKLQLLDEKSVKNCTKCRLHETRKNTVFGEGNPEADIFFIGEGPGETEDNTGRPFVGRAGQLLDKMIASIGFSRADVFIANIVKCRPPENRVPGADEVAACTPYLLQQLEILKPKVIVTLGRPATIYMLNSKLAMGALRGKWHTWRGIKLMPTFHPSYVLRVYTEEVRNTVWNDFKMVLAEIGLKK